MQGQARAVHGLERYAYFQQGADETTLTRHHPPFPGSSSEPYTVINIFHFPKPEHFCPLLLDDSVAELQKVSQQKNGLLKGRVKLSAEGLDDENQAQVELKDYGQFPWGLCEGSLFNPKLPRGRSISSAAMCAKKLWLGNSSVGNSCAVTSILVGLLEAKIFTEDEFMQMLTKA